MGNQRWSIGYAVFFGAAIAVAGCWHQASSLSAEEPSPANQTNLPKDDEDLLRYRKYIYPGTLPKTLEEFTPEDLQTLRAERERIHTRHRQLGRDYLNNLKTTGDPSWVERYAALDLPYEESVAELTRLLDNPAHDVRAMAMTGLGRRGPAAAVALPKILERCRQEPEGSFVIQCAIQAFGHIGPQAAPATPFMVEQFGKRNKSNGFRNDIVLAWRKIGPGAKEAIPALEKALEEVKPVAYLGEEAKREAETERYYYAGAQVTDIVAAPERDAPLATSYRLGTHPSIVYDAYVTLGVLRDEPPLHVSELLDGGAKALSGRDSHRAFQALRHSDIDKDKSVDLLAALLKSRPPVHIHVHALETMRDLQHGTPTSVAALFELLDVSDNHVWHTTSVAMDTCCRGLDKDELTPILMQQLESKSTRAFVFAVRWLSDNNEDADFTVPRITKALQNCFAAQAPPRERIVACLGFLRANGPEAAEVYPVLLELCEKTGRLDKQQRDYYRGCLLLAMSQTRIDVAAVPMINDVLASSEQHFEIAAAARAAKALPSGGEKCVPHLALHLQADYRIRPLRVGDLQRKDSYAIEPVTTAREEVIHAIVAIGGEQAQTALPHLRTWAKETDARSNMTKRVVIAAAKAVEELSK